MDQDDLMLYHAAQNIQKDDGQPDETTVPKKWRQADRQLPDGITDAMELISALLELLGSIFSI